MTVTPEIFNCRMAGVLLHLRSLGPDENANRVFHWLDFMADAGLKVWQFLPLGVPHEDGSPYQTQSAFAVDPCLFPEAAMIFGFDPHGEEFDHFCSEQAHWLDDYALYSVLKRLYAGRPWFDWLPAHRDRHSGAIEHINQHHAEELRAIKWQQYSLLEYWKGLHRHAGDKNIQLFGDLPIFVAHDSADVWSHQGWFLLDEEGQLLFESGVPPDYFSATGQHWGNPHYNWEAMQEDGFSWWLARIRYLLEWVDIFRIDHFRGFEAVWMIDAGSETAAEGQWQKTGGDALLATIQDKLGPVPMVAENLGVITPEVTELQERYKLPGMAVLQFAFDEFEDNPHKPWNINYQTVAYTGTHDNDTTAGWYSSLSEEEQTNVRESLSMDPDDDPVWSMIDSAMASKAWLAVVPMQDFLGLGSEDRMNTPGTVNGNWQWLLPDHACSEGLAERINMYVESEGRSCDS